jgi:hypothetical protein
MVSALRPIGILLFALAAACAGVEEAPPSPMAQKGLLVVDPSLLGRDQDKAAAALPSRSEAGDEAIVALAPPREPAAPRQPVMTGDEAIANGPLAGAPAAPARSQSSAKAAPPPVNVPEKISASALQSRKDVGPGPVARKLEPPLDVAALKARLRDTDAIGVLTKLALKNQVDDLLKQFRAYHLGGQKTSVDALRQPYDMLVLKVLALVQDSDPSLARTISGSREAIWGILADPEKFNSVS